MRDARLTPNKGDLAPICVPLRVRVHRANPLWFGLVTEARNSSGVLLRSLVIKLALR